MHPYNTFVLWLATTLLAIAISYLVCQQLFFYMQECFIFRDAFIFAWTNQVCLTISGARRDFFVRCWKFIITLNGWVTVSTARITHTESSELHYSLPCNRCSSEMWFMQSSFICSEVICRQPKQKHGQVTFSAVKCQTTARQHLSASPHNSRENISVWRSVCIS